jgi:hypothetical protein
MAHWRQSFEYGLNGKVVAFILSAYLENKTKKSNDAAHTCRMSTRSVLSFIVGFGFVDCIFDVSMLSESTVGMSYRMPESLSFAVGVGGRTAAYAEYYPAAASTILISKDDPYATITEKMAVECMKNMKHVIQDTFSVKQEDDYAIGAKFCFKPEKLLIEGAAWYFLTQEVGDDLVKLLFKVFPDNDDISRKWRLSIASSMLSLQTTYTTGGFTNWVDDELYHHGKEWVYDYPGFTKSTMPTADDLYEASKCPMHRMHKPIPSYFGEHANAPRDAD